MRGPKLPDSTQLYYNQGYLDLELHYPIQSAGAHFGTMLDLGCGTGLAGVAFRPHVDWLVGVDLSPKMIEEARRKALYDGHPVAARQDNMPVISFHPEIAGEPRVHELFLRDVR